MINDKRYPRRLRGESCGEFLHLARRSWGIYEGVFDIVAMDSMNQSNVLNPENVAMVDDLCSEVCEEAVGNADRDGEVAGHRGKLHSLPTPSASATRLM